MPAPTSRGNLALMPGPTTVQSGNLTHVAAIVAYDHIARSGDSQRVAEVREAARSGWLRVAIRDGKVLGHAIVRPRAFFGFDFLDLVYVAAAVRRNGIGRLLLRSVRDQAPRRVWTSTNLSNVPMQRLLRGDGWHAAGMLHGLDEGDPEVFYFSDGSVGSGQSVSG